MERGITQSQMLRNELRVLRARRVPDTDPRIKAIKRILDKQEPTSVVRHTNNIPFGQVEGTANGRRLGLLDTKIKQTRNAERERRERLAKSIKEKTTGLLPIRR